VQAHQIVFLVGKILRNNKPVSIYIDKKNSAVFTLNYKTSKTLRRKMEMSVQLYAPASLPPKERVT
jgi:hypothetical protein